MTGDVIRLEKITSAAKQGDKTVIQKVRRHCKSGPMALPPSCSARPWFAATAPIGPANPGRGKKRHAGHYVLRDQMHAVNVVFDLLVGAQSSARCISDLADDNVAKGNDIAMTGSGIASDETPLHPVCR